MCLWFAMFNVIFIINPFTPISYILIILSVCHRAWVRHRRPTGPGPALPDSRISTNRARRGGCRAGSVTEGRPALWSPAWVERAWPFSGSQHGRSVAWKKNAALLQVREEEEEDRGEKRRREEKSVAWRRSAALLQTRKEEEEDKGEKIRR